MSGSAGLGLWTASNGEITRVSDVQISGSTFISSSLEVIGEASFTNIINFLSGSGQTIRAFQSSNTVDNLSIGEDFNNIFIRSNTFGIGVLSSSITPGITFHTSGSTKHGGICGITVHQFTGSVEISCSLSVVGDISVTGLVDGVDVSVFSSSTAIEINNLQADSSSFSTRVTTNEGDIVLLEATASNHEGRLDNIDLSGSAGLGLWTASNGLISRESAVQITGSMQIVNKASSLPVIGSPTLLFVANTGSSAAISIIAGNSGNSILNFGDLADENICNLDYNHVTNNLDLKLGSTTKITFEAIEGRIGIGPGSSAPGAKLDISGSIANEGLLRIQNSSGSEILFVSSSGNIGIGTITPVAPVEIQSLAASMRQTRYATVAAQSAGITVQRSGGTTVGTDVVVQDGWRVANFNLRGYDGSSYIPVATMEAWVDGAPSVGNMPGRLVFSTTAESASSVTERLRIDSSGNVGIGTTAPDVQLHIADSAQVFLKLDAIGGYTNNSEVAGIQFAYDITGNISAQIAMVSSGTNEDGGHINFRTQQAGGALTERMRVEANGNVGIGTDTPEALLHVFGTISASNILTNNGGTLWTASNGVISRESDVQITGSINITDSIEFDEIQRIVPIFIRGTGINSYTQNRVLRIGSNQVYNTTGSGLRFTVISVIDYSILSDTLYDTFGSEVNSDNLAADITSSIHSGSIGILTSFNHWEESISTTLRDAFLLYGLTTAGNVNLGTDRRPYAAIFNGTPDGLSSNAVELIYRSTASNPPADLTGWLIDGAFSVNGGKPTSLVSPDGNVNTLIINDTGKTIIDGDLLVSGSVKLGVLNTEVHEITGSVNISGSLNAGVSASGAGIIFAETGSFQFLEKAAGTFKIPHPDPSKSDKNLYHSFVESPTGGDNLYRYRIEATLDNEEVVMDLPDYWQFLNENPQVWVNPYRMLAQCTGWVSDDLKKLHVLCEKAGKYEVLLIGTRKDAIANKYWSGVERSK